ncbi:VanZ family protein [Bradyrhizobium genosp. P]|uniref:VanZ family protein n=1 Tax=Bradyrhizobium genosp. P TaxID=83641 RepID=UPI003CF8C312
MLEKLLSVAAWALLAFIVYITISPLVDRPRLTSSASFEHVAAFAALGALFFLAYPRHIVLVCLIVIGSAVLLERMQLLTPDRHARLHDAIEKIAGGAAGMVAAQMVLLRAKASGWFKTGTNRGRVLGYN